MLFKKFITDKNTILPDPPTIIPTIMLKLNDVESLSLTIDSLNRFPIQILYETLTEIDDYTKITNLLLND